MENHKIYLKKLLGNATASFGVIGVLVTILFPYFIEVSKSITWITYLAAILCFYLASYKVWLEASPIEDVSSPVHTVNVLGNHVTHTGGNGYYFISCILENDILISNNSEQGITIKDIAFKLRVNTDSWLKLENSQSIVNVDGTKLSNSFSIDPKQNINLKIRVNGKGILQDAEKLAREFSKNNKIPGVIELQVLVGSEVLHQSVEVEIDLFDLINEYRKSWKKNNQKALNILEGVS